MGWRIVKQPNGLLASFSEIVDDFLEMNMNEDEAIDYCREDCGLGEHESRDKVSRGLKDLKPHSAKEGNGLSRWNDALETVGIVHGIEAAEERLNEGSVFE